MDKDEEVYLTGMHCTNNGALIGLEGGACRLLVEAFAEQFKESGAVNYLELTFNSKDHGDFIVTLQKAGGITPAGKVARMKELIRSGNIDDALAV